MLLSIDPSSTELGWAVFNGALIDYGLIKASKKKKWERFQLIVKALNSIADRYGIDEVACERTFVSSKIRAEALTVVFRCIKEWAKERRLKFYVYSPMEWKKSVIGNHMADKEEVAMIVLLHYPELPRDLSNHVTDAIAIGLHREGIKKWELMAGGGE